VAAGSLAGPGWEARLGGVLGADFVPLGGVPSLGSGRKIAMNDNLEHPLGKRVR